MRKFKTMMLSVTLAVVLVVMIAQPALGVAAANASFSEVKYDENGLMFNLRTDQCVTEENPVQVRDRNGELVIAPLVPVTLDVCDGTGDYKYFYDSSVVDATYDSIRLHWGGTLSPPIFHGMDLTPFDLTYYLQGLDDVHFEIENNLYVKLSGNGDTYVTIENKEVTSIRQLNEKFGYVDIPDNYFVVEDFEGIVGALPFPWGILFPVDPSTIEARALFIAKYVDDEIYKQTLYMTDPILHSTGQLLSLDSPGGEIEIDIPRTGWEIKKVVVMPKDEIGSIIAPIEFEYDDFSRIYLPDVGLYDIQVIGTVDDYYSGEMFILTKKDVSIQPYGTTKITYNEEDIIEVEPELKWNELEGLSDEFDGMRLDNVWMLPGTIDSFQSLLTAYPIAFNNYVEQEVHKLYLTKNGYEQIGWDFCLAKDGYCPTDDAFIYVTNIPKNDGNIRMSNELISDLRLDTTILLDLEIEMEHNYGIPYKLDIYDSNGNTVFIMSSNLNEGYGKLVFQKYGQTHPVGRSNMMHPLFSMIMPFSLVTFPSDWEPYEEEPSYGLYEVFHETASLPVKMKKPQYLYYLNEEQFVSMLSEAGLPLNEPLDLQRIVQSMRTNADTDFWRNENESIRSFHIQFLMEFIQSDRLNFYDHTID